MAYISLMGLYRYNNQLFDDCVFPDDSLRDIITAELLTETAELEVLYPDYDIMKMMLGVYSKSRINEWNRIFRALTEEYNPIWNKDGWYEEQENTENTGNTRSVSNSNSKHYVTAYNDDAPKQSTEDTGTINGNADVTGAGKLNRTRREYGNIGVTKSSELVQDEIVLRATNDITHIIVAEIKKRFCLMIY